MMLTGGASMNRLRAVLGAALVVATLTAPGIGTSLASFNSTARDTAGFAAQYWPDVFYLHDDGNHTAEITMLSMDTVAPTGALSNFSDNCTWGALGRQIGDDQPVNRSSACDLASWVTPPLAARTINGTATLTLFTGISRFNRGAPDFDPTVGYGGTLTVEVQHLASNGTVKASTSTSITRADWMHGSNAWVSDTFTFAASGYQIATNDQVRITVYMRVVNPNGGSKGLAFIAYDAAAYQSRLVLP